MRARHLIPTVALLLSSGLAWGQQPQTPAAPLNGTLDVGFRASSIDGDAARFQRYQDIRTKGAGLNFTVERRTPAWVVTVGGQNVGYLDQQFQFTAVSGRVKASFEWDQTPLFYGSTTSTAYVETSPGVFSLDSAARLSVQNGKAVGIPLTPLQAQTPSIYRTLARTFDLKSRRDTAAFRLAVAATRDLTLKVELETYRRTGAQPWGAGFAFGILPEVPLGLDNRTTNLQAGAEWTNPRGMARLGYEGSFFSNSIETLTWDNPVRATDYNQNPRTVTGYDPSGYVTGNGPAKGRMALSPSNHTNGVNGMGLIKLPARSSLRAAFSVVGMAQNADLIPWTTNPVIADPRVYASFPNLASPGRTSAQMDVRQTNARLNFTTHPNRYFGLTLKYRYFNRDDRTPAFDGTQYVRFDAVPESSGGKTEHLNLTRNTVNLDAVFTPIPYTALRVGVGRDTLDHARAYGRLGDTTVRASVDTVGNQYLTLRALYEHTKREATRFDPTVLAAAGAQPASRWYDDASRTRNRATVLVDVMPIPVVDFSATAFTGKDTYDDGTQRFGLLNDENTGYTVGLSIVPSRRVSFGATYGHEKYTSLQRSRTASPAPDSSWTDPNRDWNLNHDEKVNTFGLNAGLIEALPKTEIRVGYDWNDSDQGFVHGGPRIDALTAIGQFIPLPAVTNKWQRATVDVRYFVSARVGIGVGYWYNKYDVNDYQTLNLPDGTPRTDAVGGLMLGYGYRPFNANTGFFRVFYTF